MKKKLQYIGICLAIVIAAVLIVGNIGQIFLSNDKKLAISLSEKDMTRNHSYNTITNLVSKYNKELPKAIGGGLNLIHAKYDANMNSILFSIEGTDSITYEKLQMMFPKIKSNLIHELQDVIEKESDPLIMSLIEAGTSINYVVTADTINFKIRISPDDLKRKSTHSKEILAKNYLKEYEKKINSQMPDIDNSGEGMLKVKYDVDDNNLIWYCLTTCDESQADDAYHQTLLNLRETYRNRTDAVVDAIVESKGKTQFIYQSSKGKVVFSFTITGKDISNY